MENSNLKKRPIKIPYKSSKAENCSELWNVHISDLQFCNFRKYHKHTRSPTTHLGTTSYKMQLYHNIISSFKHKRRTEKEIISRLITFRDNFQRVLFRIYDEI